MSWITCFSWIFFHSHPMCCLWNYCRLLRDNCRSRLTPSWSVTFSIWDAWYTTHAKLHSINPRTSFVLDYNWFKVEIQQKTYPMLDYKSVHIRIYANFTPFREHSLFISYQSMTKLLGSLMMVNHLKTSVVHNFPWVWLGNDNRFWNMHNFSHPRDTYILFIPAICLQNMEK